MTRRRLYNYYKIYANGDGYYCLDSCYAKPSSAKIKAFNDCIEKARNARAEFNARILTFNRMMFTYGFTHYINGVKYFTVITKTGLTSQEVEKLNAYGHYLLYKQRKNSK